MPIPPIYIINLKRTPERRLQMQRQLDAFNLSYQFVDAVDKHLLHLEEYRTTIANQLDIDTSAIPNLFKPRPTTPKHRYMRRLAVRLSHIKVYDLMIKNNIPAACVLEDDCFLLPSFPKILTAAQRVSWDVLMLASNSYCVNDSFNPMKQSLRIFSRKLMHYKKYCPQLNSFMIRLMILKAIKVLYLKHTQYKTFGCNFFSHMVGAIPEKEKSAWYKATFNHYIASPYFPSPKIGSAMTYMLTLPTAIKLKEIGLHNDEFIDLMLYDLYNKGEMNLRILVPPCSIPIIKYIQYSVRTK